MGLSGLRSGDSERLMSSMLGEEMGSDSLEQPALLLQAARGGPGVAAHWKDMGSKSKLEIPAAGGQRSRSSSGTRLSLRVWALRSSLLSRASSREVAETASLVERGLRGQRGGGSPVINDTDGRSTMSSTVANVHQTTDGARLPSTACKEASDSSLLVERNVPLFPFPPATSEG